MTASETMTKAEALALIPWLVNGSLEPAEAAAVEAHVATCETCAAEFESQRRLAHAIAALPQPAVSTPAAWARLEAAVAGAPQPQRSMRTVFGELASDITALVRRIGVPTFAFGGAAAMAALLAVAVVPVAPQAPYETLTRPGGSSAVGDTVELRVRPVPGADLAAIRQALQDAGAVEIAAPTASGLIRANIAAGDREAARERLSNDPLFLVVAVD